MTKHTSWSTGRIDNLSFAGIYLGRPVTPAVWVKLAVDSCSRSLWKAIVAVLGGSLVCCWLAGLVAVKYSFKEEGGREGGQDLYYACIS